jgi:hypothetical protein
MNKYYPLEAWFPKISFGIHLIVAFILFSTTAKGQKIEVWQGAQQYPFNSTIAFPPAADSPPNLDFIIKNSGTSDLLLTGEPLVRLNKVLDFFLINEPSSTVIRPGDSAVFTISYYPSSAEISTARMFIVSNDPDNESFIVNLTGPGKMFYGSTIQWPGSAGIQHSGEEGNTGGASVRIENVSIAGKTNTYWGLATEPDGRLSLSLSLDGAAVSDVEVMKFVKEESDLNQGILVWKGVTTLSDAIGGGAPVVYTRATLKTAKDDGSAFSLVDPASLGLPAHLGGLAKINSENEILEANLLIEASFSPNSNYLPYQEFFALEAVPSDPPSAYFHKNISFYWYNLAPEVEKNLGLFAKEGGREIINTELINIFDESSPESISFYFDPITSGDNPLKNGTGYLILNNDTLYKSDFFTLHDLEQGYLSYVHNGEEQILEDEFYFIVKDGKGVTATENNSSVFSFRIEIEPVNDLPVAENDTIVISYKGTYYGQLIAVDEEQTPLVFEVVDQPVLGTLNVEEDGRFTYTSLSPEAGTDLITFRAFDGQGYSNLASVFIHLVNTAPLPVAQQSTVTRENIAVSGQLLASDEEGETITFSLVADGLKGTIEMTESGEFVYTPHSGAFGTDLFFFKAVDQEGNESSTVAYSVHIKPSLDEGDVLIADGDKIRIIDPVTGQDSIVASGNYIKEARNLFYKNGTSIFLVDAESGLVKIDPETGQQTLLVDVLQFSMLPSDPLAPAMIMDRNGNLIMADGVNGIVKIDTTTGFIESVYRGGSLQFASGILQLKNDDLIVGNAGVIFGSESSILKISPNNAVVTIASGNNVLFPLDIALIDQDNIYVADGGTLVSGTDNIFKLNLDNGSIEEILSGEVNWPTGIDFQLKQQLFYAVNQGDKTLVQYDAQGTRTVIETEDGLDNPFGLFVIQRTNQKPVLAPIDEFSGIFGTVFTIDLDTILTDDADALADLLVEVESSNRNVVEASVDGTSIILICLGSGGSEITIKATDLDGAFTFQSFKVYVDREVQVITFDPIPDKAISSPDFILVANSNAQLPVTFEALTSNISVEGDRVKVLAPGLAQIKARQDGTDEYEPATPVIRSFCVIPGKPEIFQETQDDGTVLLTSANAEGNQWYFNNKRIVGETGTSLLASQSGFYGLKTIIDGCEGELTVIDILITGFQPRQLSSLMEVFPIPADNQVSLRLATGRSEAQKIEIIDMMGQTVYSGLSDEEYVELNIEKLSSGQYILKVSTAEGLAAKRFIKR